MDSDEEVAIPTEKNDEDTVRDKVVKKPERASIQDRSLDSVAAEDQADFNIAWIELKSSRNAFTKMMLRVKNMLESADEGDKLHEMKVGLKTLEDLWDRGRDLSNEMLRSPCADDAFTKKERQTRVELQEEFEDLRFTLEVAISRAKGVMAEAEGSRRIDSREPNLPLNSTMAAASCPLRYDCKDIIQRISRFEGDPTKFQRWKDAFELHVDSKNWDNLEKFEFLNKTIGGKAWQAIASIRVSASNYINARDTIYNRFGNADSAEDQHAQNIFNACHRKELHIHDKFIAFAAYVVQNIECIVALGNSLEGLSAAFSAPLIKALPNDQLRRFDDCYQRKKDSNCKLRVLVDFLKEEQSKLERMNAFKAENNVGSREDKTKNQNSRYKKFEVQKAGSSGYKNPKHDFAFAATTSKADHSCIFCSEEHPSTKCRNKLSVEERRKAIVTQRACYKCLIRNHNVDKCRKKENCSKCGGRHHEMICNGQKSKKGSTSAAATASEDVTSAAAVSGVSIIAIGRAKGLPTGYVEAHSAERKLVCRVMLDTGSQKTFVTSSFAEKLGATSVGKDKFYLQSAGYASAKKCVGDIFEITLKSRFANNKLAILATALPTVIEGKLPNLSYEGKLKPIADENKEGWSDEVDILIGVDFLPEIVGAIVKKSNGLIALETIFGYFLCGVGREKKPQLDQSLSAVISKNRQSWSGEAIPRVNSLAAVAKKYEGDDIAFLWETEMMGVEPYFKESDEAENEELNKFFWKTVVRLPSGRYQISLPFKPTKGSLGSNRKLTENRLKGFLIKAKKDKKWLEAIDCEIEDLIAQGFIEVTEPPVPGQPAHYLPLLAVKKAGSTDDKIKVRLVNDAGARSRDESGLNDVLHQGENLIADISSVLLRFRQLPIAICADIEKAYLQYEVNPEHRTYLRFLWPLGVSKNPNAPVKEFMSSRLSFGLVSSPWLHCAGIRHHLENEIEKNPQHRELLEYVKQNFYVDDLTAPAEDVEEAKRVVDTLVDVFKAGCFPLKKFATCDAGLGKYIINRYPDATVAFEEENFKFLGVRWNQRKDSLHLDVSGSLTHLETNVATKRNILKAAAMIFDPLGFASPICLAFKIQLQQLWLKKMDWDEPLQGADLDVFKENVERLKSAALISTARHFGVSRKQRDTAVIELHVFCDASLKAYGCVAYARKVHRNGLIEVSLILGKGRVAPLKGEWSIHRLELLGALIASRITNKICQSARQEFASVNFWCDNACVLAWIRDDPSRWKQFIGNRVKEIQSRSDASQWQYVRTVDNPADLVSRAAPLDTPEQREFWLSGPKWLKSADGPERHSLNPENTVYDVSNERKAQCVVGAVMSFGSRESIGLKQLSSWEKAVRILAYVRRWLTYKRKRASRQRKSTGKSVITSAEYFEAELSILKGIQLRRFAAELTSGLEKIEKSSQIYQFNPVLDENGLIRCNSRLRNSAEMMSDAVNPIILPGEDDMVNLYLTWMHEKMCLHAGGVAGIIQRVRRRFLILRVRRAAAKVMLACKVCARYRAKPGQEVMPPLPKFRIDKAPPFAVTGVDAAGPFMIKNDKGCIQKAWVMLFACPLTRAVRLELVRDLSTYEFLLSFRRFFNRNATVGHLVSDNAASFRRAAKEMNFLFKVNGTEEVQQFLARHQIRWTFNVARSPWRVSFYERVFRMLKEPLRKVMARNILPAFEFMTLLTDFEKIINDRPITAVSTDPNEPLPLKPSDLLGGYQTYPTLPDVKEVAGALKGIEPAIFSQRWKAQQTILNSFWVRFKREYLQQLRSAHAAKPVQSRQIKAGDVVLVDDPAPSRGYWPLALVTEVSGGESSDGRRRTCTIRLASGKKGKIIKVKRPIQLLYPLDCSRD